MKKIWSLIKDNKGFVLFIFFLIIFRGAVADWHPVPTGSMKPTILEGDVIWENKMAYDLQVPFTDISLMKTGEPERGDIIVFTSEVADKRLIKRLIGLPGDTIHLKKNHLIINGNVVDYKKAAEIYVDAGEKKVNIFSGSDGEIVPSRMSDQEPGLYVEESYTDLKPHALNLKDMNSNYPPAFRGPSCQDLTELVVPEDHYFFLGDNRDNSLDSRCYGYVPRSELRGHATHILLSLNKNDSYKPRFERFFEKLK